MLQKQPPPKIASCVPGGGSPAGCVEATSSTKAAASAWFDRLTMSAHPERVEGCALCVLRGRPRRVSRVDSDADRTRHAGAAEAAVAVGILREVLLVVILRVVELRRG